MKRLLLAVATAASLFATGALAADLPVKAPYTKAPVIPVWNWTGFYIGGNAGYSWGNSGSTATVDRFLTGLPLPAALNNGVAGTQADVNGWIGGAQAGYNWQYSRDLLFGLEADIQGSGERGSGTITCTACSDDGTPIFTNLNEKLKWFGTVRARGGVLVTPDLLLYATGGLAYGEIGINGTAVGNFNQTTVILPGVSSTRTGWTAGLGVESHLWDNWTVKLEWLYMDLGSVSAGPVQLTGIIVPVRTVGGLSYSANFTDNMFRIGANYHFNTPVMAKY